MKNIAILGSTGSIGQSTLEVIKQFPGKFRVIGLTTNANIDILHSQINLFRPSCVCVANEEASLRLKSRLKGNTKLLVGGSGLEALCKDARIDELVVAISGSSALSPLLAAIESGKDIALANKEALVMAGSLIMKAARRKKVKIIPIDSEQSAIWQCLVNEDKQKLRSIYLTASGGPFRVLEKSAFKRICVTEALRHPRWRMGKKISVDSATLMNKGLELLEAMYLFDVGADKIKIVIHPESIIHSMVEFVDGVILAQLSITDMRIPIQYALSYPERLENRLPSVDFFKIKSLNFQKPDFKKFSCLALAYQAAGDAGTAPTVLNAANEVCVEEFLKKKLAFDKIPKVIEKVLGSHCNKRSPRLADILQTDSWAREETKRIIL